MFISNAGHSSVCARHVYCFQGLKTCCTVYSMVIQTQGQQLFYHSVETVNRFPEIWTFSIIGFYSELNLDFRSSKRLEPLYVLQVSVIIIHMQACFITSGLCTFNLTHSVYKVALLPAKYPRTSLKY